VQEAFLQAFVALGQLRNPDRFGAWLAGIVRAFAGTSIQVFRIRDGQILLFRDYFNPRGFEDLLRP
jgi:ketosteroid isomerase-like protein